MSTEQIKLTVNPAKRVLEYDGTLILGVKGDNCAQRIFFECPKSINEFIDDMTSDNITVFVDYKNAYGEPYVQECAKPVTFDDNTVTFSWIITKLATAKAGNVTFNVCIKKTVDGVLENEWHTTNNMVGKVLDSVDVSKKTPEVITPDTVTIENLTLEVAALKSTLQDTEEYINGEVESQVSAEMNQYNTRLDPVYVTGNSVFTTNLALFDTFTIAFKASKADSAGANYIYHNTEFGKQGTLLGFVTYGNSTGFMYYTIKGTRVGNDGNGNMRYVLEFITGDSNASKDDANGNDIPDSLSNVHVSVVDGVIFGLSVSDTVTDAYLVGRKF